MSIINKTSRLGLTQFTGNLTAFANLYSRYNADMLIIDDAIGVFEQQISDKVDGLEALVNSYETRVSDLETCCSDVNVTLTNYGSRLNSIERVIDTVSTQNIDDIIARVDALENKVQANTDNIDIVKLDVSDLKDRVSSLETKQVEDAQQISRNTGRIIQLETCCTEVQQTITGLSDRIDANASDILTLGDRLTRDEGNIAANAQDIVILSSQVSANTSDIEDLKSAFDALDPTSQFELVRQVAVNTEAIGTLNTVTANHTISIGNLNDRMDLVDAEVADLTARVIQVEADIAQVQNWETRIGALESGLTVTDGKADDALDYLGDWSGYRTAISDNTATVAGQCGAYDTHFGVLDSAVGVLTNLTTTVKSSLVEAINEVNASVGTASSDLTALTARVGTCETDIGALSTRMTTAEGNITSIGGRVTDIETLNGNTTMTTTAQTLTGAIEEINVAEATLKSRVDDIETDVIGNWLQDQGPNYTINEWCNDMFIFVHNYIMTSNSIVGTEMSPAPAQGNIQPVVPLNTSAQDIIGAVNEVDAHTDTNTTNIGDLTQLNTTDKSSLVNAVNEVISSVGLTAIQNALHPVGSVYLTIGNTNPGTLLGFGTWTQLADGYLRNGASLANATGGSLTSGSHVLTTSEIPSHTHDLSNHTHDWSNSHSHGITQTAHSHGGSFGTSEGNRGGSYGSVPVGYTTSTNGANANITINSATISGTTGAPSNNTSGSTGSGNGHTHSIEPTYTRVYAWERTA